VEGINYFLFRVQTQKENYSMNLTVAFHSNQLGFRGTEVSLFDYAHYNETILGNRSIILSDKNGNMDALQRFTERFQVYLYDQFSEVEAVVDQEGIDAIFYSKAGDNDGKLVTNARNCIQVVFPSNDVHGDRYLYISQWLANHCGVNAELAVPYIVTLPDVTENLREELGIPSTATVFGRHGGFSTFDIDTVRECVVQVAKERPDTYFLFLNTPRFCDLPNVLYLPPTTDLVRKTAFINSCDAMIYGRKQGETFGLAIAEFLHQDKPVIAHPFGEQNHVAIMMDHGLWYRSPEELYHQLTTFSRTEPVGTYSNLVKKFAPEPVMRQFEAMYLDNL